LERTNAEGREERSKPCKAFLKENQTHLFLHLSALKCHLLLSNMEKGRINSRISILGVITPK
jgi:hypothetical protein